MLVSKVAAEFLGVQAFLALGVRASPGLGRSITWDLGYTENFVVSALARRMVEAERSKTGSVREAISPPRAHSPTCARDVLARVPTACLQRWGSAVSPATSVLAGRSASRLSQNRWWRCFPMR